MKALFSAIALFLISVPAFCGPVTLLDCRFEHSPIQSAMVYELNGRLYVLTIPTEGEWIRRVLPAEEWSSRIIHLSDTQELKAVIFVRDDQWHFSFKGPNGWYMSGNADCTTP